MKTTHLSNNLSLLESGSIFSPLLENDYDELPKKLPYGGVLWKNRHF